MSQATRPGRAATAPAADGPVAARLAGSELPGLTFHATTGGRICLRELAAGMLVPYVYPRTGRPGVPDPPGWDTVPGARGCTAQACAFGGLSARFDAAGALIAGLSAQEAGDQREAPSRLRLPFPLLADPRLRLAAARGLPTFGAGPQRLYCRLTLIASAAIIVKTFYPVDRPASRCGGQPGRDLRTDRGGPRHRKAAARWPSARCPGQRPGPLSRAARADPPTPSRHPRPSP